MNSLSAYGKCCCNACQPFEPPRDTPVAFPWDCLTVQFTEDKYILRRCCSVTTPLGTAMGGYSGGAVVPYYQPVGVGPALNSLGDYSLSAVRSKSLQLGVDDENVVDCTAEFVEGVGFVGGSYAYYDAATETCVRAAIDEGSLSVSWGNLGAERGSYLAVSQPDDKGHRYAVFEEVGAANLEVNAPGVTVVVWNLETGESWSFCETAQGLIETLGDYASGTFNGSHTTLDGHGQRLAIGPNKRVRMMRADTANRRVHFHILRFDKTVSGGRWITTNDIPRVVVADYTTGVTPVAYQIDNSDYYLAVQRVGGVTRIYRGGPGGMALLVPDAPSDCLPFCYQRVGKRHVFLAATGTVDAYNLSSSTLYDITEGDTAGVCHESSGVNDISSSGIGGAYYVSIDPEGDIIVAGGGGVAKVTGTPWFVGCTGSPNISVLRTTHAGWYHVRGALYEGGTTLYNAVNYQPGSTYQPGFTTQTTLKTRSWMIHPDGPTSGITICRQYTADNSAIPASGDDERPSGTEIIQFSGGLHLGEYDSEHELIVAAPTYFAVNAAALDETPAWIYSDGIQADPTLPNHYGPGASGAF